MRNCGGEAQGVMKTPSCWKCQDDGASPEEAAGTEERWLKSIVLQHQNQRARSSQCCLNSNDAVKSEVLQRGYSVDYLLLGFVLTLVWFSLPTFHFSLWEWECTLWHYILDLCNLVFYYIRAHS